jgi:hypothetical protein
VTDVYNEEAIFGIIINTQLTRETPIQIGDYWGRGLNRGIADRTGVPVQSMVVHHSKRLIFDGVDNWR